jgi:hypothetical protein
MYRDTGTGELSWAFGLAPMDALASLELEVPVPAPGPAGGEAQRARVELRLLGASHQVLVFAPPVTCSETVACLPGGPLGLVPAASVRVPGWVYEFAATVQNLPAVEFDRRVNRLRRVFATYRSGIAGAFPGSPHALTAVVASTDGAGFGWRTWHTYPQQHQIVTTRTRLAVQQEAAAPSPSRSGLVVPRPVRRRTISRGKAKVKWGPPSP